MKNKNLYIILLTLACGLGVTLFYKLGWFEVLELKTLDFRFRLFAEPEKASKEIVIVAIDEKSLREFKRNNVVWKWPRDIYAALVRYLHRGGARAIIFDILFTDPDIDRLSSDAEETDGAFARSMAEAGNVLLAAHLRREEDVLSQDNPLLNLPDFQFQPAGCGEKFESFSTAVLPVPLFQQSAAGLGVANYYEDKDGICRRIPLFLNFNQIALPHLGVAAFLFIQNII
ncbi:MAG: CHASE2 domain-containing protein [Calditrichaeota bacterium]|nr:MAG: CHASE2 domain-containing protein [Calditrichota bacterium]